MTKKTSALSPSARKNMIAQVIADEVIDSQESLVSVLKKRGVSLTQTTASRDLVEMGAYRGKDRQGIIRYFVPLEHATPTKPKGSELLLAATASGNIAVLRTPPGGAQLLASSLDHSSISTLIGTIAGDDTVLAIAKSAQGGSRLIKEIEDFLVGTPVKSSRNVARKNSAHVKKR